MLGDSLLLSEAATHLTFAFFSQSSDFIDAMRKAAAELLRVMYSML